MDWRYEQNTSELFDLIELAGSVEDIPIYQIKELCEAKAIPCERFIEVWVDLCDEAHIIINKAEEQMY